MVVSYYLRIHTSDQRGSPYHLECRKCLLFVIIVIYELHQSVEESIMLRYVYIYFTSTFYLRPNSGVWKYDIVSRLIGTTSAKERHECWLCMPTNVEEFVLEMKS